jgi:PleD family two-component response regulator
MVVSRALRAAGYRDIRVANDSPSALKMMEERPVSLLIADWLMPEMDGLQLTDRVRQHDEQQNHYTYVILLTARESMNALSLAFDRGVDDFISKSDMNKQLVSRVFAADRMADRQNSLLAANSVLIENIRQLEATNIIDLETGLCNQLYARERLGGTLREAEARNGTSAYVLIGIRNWQDLKKRNSSAVMSELAEGIGRRLNSLIRPMDALCRVAENQYAIIAYFANRDHCSTGAFRRIFDGINHKAFKTTAGYVSVEAGMALCKADTEKGELPNVDDVEKTALQGLADAYDTRRFVETRARPAADI